MGLKNVVRHRAALRAVLLSSALALTAATSSAQVFFDVRGKAPIPREGLKTWSLFLVTSQEWLMPANAQRLKDLYDRSRAFGAAIGKDHAAVWFWKKDARLNDPAIADNVDVDRANAYYQKLGLKPSAGPYLLFTASYPDESAAPASFTVIALANKSADDIKRLFDTLQDQLVTEGVVRNGTIQQAPGSDDFWSAWFDATRHAIASLGSGFTFVVRTPTFTIESGSKPGGGD